MRAPADGRGRPTGPATGTVSPSSASSPLRRLGAAGRGGAERPRRSPPRPAGAPGRPGGSRRPRIGSQPRLSTRGTSGPSAVGTSEHDRAPACAARRRSKGAWSRGASTAVLEAPRVGQGVGQGRLLVEQLGGPVPDPAGLDQDARGRRRPAGRRRSSSPSTSQGSHDSMPSNCWPSASRSHCWRPQGAVPTRAAARSAAWRRRPTSSRQPNSSTRSRSSVERWSADVEAGRAGRPRRPTGRCGPARRRSRGTRRRCRPARPARRGARRSTRGGSRGPPARPPGSSTTTRSPPADDHGPGRGAPRPEALQHGLAPGPPRCPGPPGRRRRGPPAATAAGGGGPWCGPPALTRSKGSVSQAGNTSTGGHLALGPGSVNTSRSWASWCRGRAGRRHHQDGPAGAEAAAGRPARRPGPAWSPPGWPRGAPTTASWRARCGGGRAATGDSPGQGTGGRPGVRNGPRGGRRPRRAPDGGGGSRLRAVRLPPEPAGRDEQGRGRPRPASPRGRGPAAPNRGPPSKAPHQGQDQVDDREPVGDPRPAPSRWASG